MILFICHFIPHSSDLFCRFLPSTWKTPFGNSISKNLLLVNSFSFIIQKIFSSCLWKIILQEHNSCFTVVFCRYFEYFNILLSSVFIVVDDSAFNLIIIPSWVSCLFFLWLPLMISLYFLCSVVPLDESRCRFLFIYLDKDVLVFWIGGVHFNNPAKFSGIWLSFSVFVFFSNQHSS